MRTWADLAPLSDGADAEGLAATLTGGLAEPWPGLWVLPLAGLVDGRAAPPPAAALVGRVLAAGRRVWRVLVVDLPPGGGPPVDAAAGLADLLVAVGRCDSAGAGGALAALDWWAAAGHDAHAAGAVITGVRSRAPLAPCEVRAVLGERLWALLGDQPMEFAAAAEDGLLLLDRRELPAVQTLVTLANRMVAFPDPAG